MVISIVPTGAKVELHAADLIDDMRIQGSNMGSNHFRIDMPPVSTTT
ncbi:MAG: hypothetical protein AAGE80_17830 [Pseudomonadota bacterium]